LNQSSPPLACLSHETIPLLLGRSCNVVDQILILFAELLILVGLSHFISCKNKGGSRW